MHRKDGNWGSGLGAWKSLGEGYTTVSASALDPGIKGFTTSSTFHFSSSPPSHNISSIVCMITRCNIPYRHWVWKLGLPYSIIMFWFVWIFFLVLLADLSFPSQSVNGGGEEGFNSAARSDKYPLLLLLPRFIDYLAYLFGSFIGCFASLSTWFLYSFTEKRFLQSPASIEDQNVQL